MRHLQTVFSGEGRKEALHGFMIRCQSFTVVKRKQTADRHYRGIAKYGKGIAL